MKTSDKYEREGYLQFIGMYVHTCTSACMYCVCVSGTVTLLRSALVFGAQHNYLSCA